jgi:hypothetical protein
MSILSNVSQAQVVMRRVSLFLLPCEKMVGRLNRCMTEQERNLSKFSPSQVADSQAGAVQVMRSAILQVGSFASRFDNVPDGFRREACAP